MTAQESVIDGLKMERKIWGQELAQQGKITSFFFFSFCRKKWWRSKSYFSNKRSNIVVIMTGSLDALLILSSYKDDVQKQIFCSTQAIIGTITAVGVLGCKYSLCISPKCQNTIILYEELLNMKLGKQGFVDSVM